MFRRWFIRSIFILPILLCIIGWGWSVNNYSYVTYNYPKHGTPDPPTAMYECFNAWGTINIACLNNYADEYGWDYRTGPIANGYFWPHFYPLTYKYTDEHHFFLGFGYCFHKRIDLIIIPYWFLILLFSMLLWVVWRKTKPKTKLGAGFQVIAKGVGQT